MDDRELAFAGAAQQARMLADGTVTAPALLDVYLDASPAWTPNCGPIAWSSPKLLGSRRPPPRPAWTRVNGCRCSVCRSPSRTTSTSPARSRRTGPSAHGPARTADAEVVRRLREAGAVFVGKTTVPEMTLWSFAETLAFGATRNPWNTDYAPGGSSGGSAAAVAAGLASMALGSDGMGSIRIPSTWCGLFGIKPQRDRVPLAPHDDAWNGLTVNGPIARTVEDAALFLDVTSDESGFVAAAAKEPGTLRIAVSTKVPSGAGGTGGRRSSVRRWRSRRCCCANSGIRSSSGIPTIRRPR